MTNSEILATLQKNEIRTVGDLDAWARARHLSRWQGLAVLVGVEAADRIIGALAVKQCAVEPRQKYRITGNQGGAHS